MQRMINACPQLGVTTLIGMHFDHNEATKRLNDRFGFQQVGHLPEIAEVNGEQRGLLLSIFTCPVGTLAYKELDIYRTHYPTGSERC